MSSKQMNPRPDSRRSRKRSKRVPGLDPRLVKKLSFFTKRFLLTDTKVLFQSWNEFFRDVVTHQGELKACILSKEIYTVALRYCCKVSFERIPYLRSDKEGIPLVIKIFKPYLNGSIDAQRAALTVLSSYKLFNPEGQYSLESIVNPFQGEQDLVWLETFKAIARKQLPQLSGSLKQGFHISGSNGPNGPCLGTAYVDREAIRDSQFEESIKELALLSGNEPLIRLLDETSIPFYESLVNDKNKPALHSKLSIKIEPGGKTRVFAIIDYFSQCCLKPYHDVIMKWLSNNRQDGSKDHGQAANAVRLWTKNPKGQVWSFDLSKATDRFPRFLEKICMEAMFGSEVAHHWENVMTNRKFRSPDGQDVMFNCGQPLGALSSWGSFTVAHHILIQTAAFLSLKEKDKDLEVSNFKKFRSYRLIGDDNSINRYAEVATWYRKLLTDIDVEINLQKSVIPEQCSGPPSAELAKRFFCGGVEITPVPPQAIIEGLKPFGLRNLFNDMRNRGYGSSGSPYPVQSIHLSRGEWAALTWPGPNAPPPLKGVRWLYGLYDHTPEDLPAGLHPGWFYWHDIPIESLEEFMKEFILHRLETASNKTDEILNQVQYNILGGVNLQGLRPIRWGRDWKPRANECYPEILVGVLDWIREEVNSAYEEIYSISGIFNKDITDLNRLVGRLHRLFEPKLLIEGRYATRDEKELTRTFMAKAIKECINFKNTGRLVY